MSKKYRYKKLKKHKKKYIYLEIGAYSLYWVLKFIEQNNDKKWKIHLFEPSIRGIRRVNNELKKINNLDITIYPVAVFNKDAKNFFYEGGRGVGWSSTLFKGKKRYLKYNNPILVDCIDFNEWVKNNLNKKDYIYVNMDIEGAEYYVLPHLIKNNTIEYFNELKIEFHAHKFIGENRNKFDIIHKELKEFFINNKFNLSLFQHL